MKRMTAALLALFLLCLTPAYAAGAEAEAQSSAALTITAPSGILMEKTTGTILYEKDAHTQYEPASVTKVMTLLLVMEAIDAGQLAWEDMVTASAHAISMGGSQIWLKENEQLSVRDMVKAVAVVSANDCAVALAEHVAGSEEAFVARMNQRAEELGMADTVFKNCNGLDEEGHVTSAYDVALMSRALLRFEKIRDYTLTWMDSVRNGETQLVNTNKLIRSYQGITGLKTGTTSQAGSCIAATAERDGMELIAVVLGADSTDHRFQDAAALLDYGFAGWEVARPQPPQLGEVPVAGGMETTVPAQVGELPSLLVEKGQGERVEEEVTWQPDLTAPITQGQTIGRITYRLDGETLGEAAITAGAAVEAVTFFAAFRSLWQAVLTWC